jgi:hypothetical protein
MNNNIKVMIMLVMAAMTAGCHTEIDVGDLPFTEVLIIRGVLQEGDTVKTLYVGKTTPYQQEYYKIYGAQANDDFKGWMNDAVVSVECDGKTYPMSYRGTGNYGNDSLIVAAGKTYRLHASWNGHHAEAVTTVPRSISIDSVTVVGRTQLRENGDWQLYDYTLEASVNNHMNSVFDMTVIQGVSSPLYSYYEGNAVCKSETAGSSDHVKLQIACNLSFATVPGFINKHTMIVQCFDEPYYFYRLSSDEQLSSQIAWNVTGDAIGMFIGATKPMIKTFIL